MLEQLVLFYEGLIRNIGGGLGRKVRYQYYKKRLARCGENVNIEEGVYFENPKDIELSNNIWIDKQAILIAGAFNSVNRKYHQKGESIIPWGKLLIDDGVHLAPQTVIQAHGGLRIGKNVTIAAGAKVYTLSHHYKNLEDVTDSKRYSFSSMAAREDQFMIVGNVIIGNNAAVGLNSVILPGTTVPEGTWIGVLSNPNNQPLTPNSVFSSLKINNE
ncbi:MAG: hypothetical protein PSV36_10765 [Algoriphagus sp.]|nr:hypothetical protein [Algoriphagus sp.]